MPTAASRTAVAASAPRPAIACSDGYTALLRLQWAASGDPASSAGADALVEEFPWVDVLPEADRLRFVADFVRAVGASAELGRWSVLAQVAR